jgi:hypothetical protein
VPIRRTDRTDTVPVFIGLSALFLGAFVYLCDRAPGSVYFVSHSLSGLSFFVKGHRLFGGFGEHLPSLIHVFAFSLITWGLLEEKNGGGTGVCLFWFTVDTMFELGQAFPTKASSLCPSFLGGLPFFENTAAFFRNGTYDPLDIASFAAGALLARVVIVYSLKRDVRHDL